MPVDFEQLAAAYDRLAVRFSVTMPKPAQTSTEEAEVDGKTVRMAVARKGLKDPQASAEAFDAVLTAVCPAGDVTFEPDSPVRLDLAPFAGAPTGPVAEAETVDVAKVRAAAELIPVALTVTRSFNVAGYGFHGENGSELRVAVAVPPRLAPRRWGDPTLLEAVDDLGTDLVPWNADDRPRHTFHTTFSSGEGPRTPDGRMVHPVVFELEVPPREARRLARLEGRIDMEYAGAKEAVRIPDALHPEHIQEVEFGAQMTAQGGQEVAVESPRLEGLGLKLTVERAAQTPGLMMVNLKWEAESTHLSEVQFFGADGRPVPAVAQHDGGDGRGRIQVLLLGTPEPPLAMAVLVTSGGPTIPLPLELTDVPIRGEPKTAPDVAKE